MQNNKQNPKESINSDKWYNNINSLFDKPFEFFPSNDLNTNGKINAMARLAIYFALFIILANKNQKWLSISVFLLLMSLFIGSTENFSDLQSSNCVKPTVNNPFMNFTLDDYYKNPNREANCPINTVRDDMRKKFLKKVERDPSDLWGQNISDRNFYTTPSTKLVNNQKDFAEWCYGTMGQCKAFGKNCLKTALTRTSNGMFTSPI